MKLLPCSSAVKIGKPCDTTPFAHSLLKSENHLLHLDVINTTVRSAETLIGVTYKHHRVVQLFILLFIVSKPAEDFPKEDASWHEWRLQFVLVSFSPPDPERSPKIRLTSEAPFWTISLYFSQKTSLLHHLQEHSLNFPLHYTQNTWMQTCTTPGVFPDIIGWNLDGALQKSLSSIASGNKTTVSFHPL